MGVHLTSFIGYHICVKESESESRSVASDSWWPHWLYSQWNSPGQNAGVGSLSLLQGISPTQGSNPGLPHCRWILYQLSHQGSPVGSCKKWKKAFQWYKGPAILWLQQRSATARPPTFSFMAGWCFMKFSALNPYDHPRVKAFIEYILCFKQQDSLKPRTVTENGDADFLSRVKATSLFLLRTLSPWMPMGGSLFPGLWSLGFWRERACECFGGVELNSTILNWIVFHLDQRLKVKWADNRNNCFISRVSHFKPVALKPDSSLIASHSALT